MRRAIKSEANGARYGAAVDDGANEERVGRSKLNSGRRSTFAALGVALLTVGALALSRPGAMVRRASSQLGGFEGEFELPEDLDAYVDEMEFGPDVYAMLGSAGPDELLLGVHPESEGEGGMLMSTEGGRNATLLRIKLLKEHLFAKDADNLHANDLVNAVAQATFDEGATQPPPVNVTSYQDKLKREIEQDKEILEKHEAMLAARAAARLSGYGDVVSGASNVNGAVVSNAINVDFCWKDSYGRGAGKIPNQCPANKETLAGGVFCYTKCHELGNYYRFGYDCHQRCGSGFTDHGLLCYSGNHGRGVGQIRCGWTTWASDSSTLGEHKSSGRRLLGGRLKTRLVCGGRMCGDLQDCWGLCYPHCPGSHPNWIGCNLCGVDCVRSGYNSGIAPSCPKKIYCSHGMEAATCAPGDDYDAGLCYPKCRSGFTGVGPVCWGTAPTVSGKKWVNCGMGAASDDAACGSAVTNQILGPLEIVAFVASWGSSGAATTGAKSGARAATKVAQAGSKASGLKDAAKALDKGMEGIGKTTGYMSTMSSISTLQSETDAIRAAAELASLVDPSGISSTVAAYAFDTCDKIHGKAS
jgi:hypothetical protein